MALTLGRALDPLGIGEGLKGATDVATDSLSGGLKEMHRAPGEALNELSTSATSNINETLGLGENNNIRRFTEGADQLLYGLNTGRYDQIKEGWSYDEVRIVAAILAIYFVGDAYGMWDGAAAGEAGGAAAGTEAGTTSTSAGVSADALGNTTASESLSGAGSMEGYTGGAAAGTEAGTTSTSAGTGEMGPPTSTDYGSYTDQPPPSDAAFQDTAAPAAQEAPAAQRAPGAGDSKPPTTEEPGFWESLDSSEKLILIQGGMSALSQLTAPDQPTAYDVKKDQYRAYRDAQQGYPQITGTTQTTRTDPSPLLSDSIYTTNNAATTRKYYGG